MERIGSALLSRFSSLLNLASTTSLTGIGSVADYIVWLVKIPTKGSGEFVRSCDDSVTVSIGGQTPPTLAIEACTASPEKASEELSENGSSTNVTAVTEATEVTSAGAETGGIFVCRSCNVRIPVHANVYFRMDMCFCSPGCRFLDVA